MKKAELYERIKSGLIFLVLGQNYFYTKNPLIEKIKTEYQLEDTKKSHDIYLLLENIDKLAWVKNQAEILLEPNNLNIISRLPWNGVITSSVDGIIDRCFRNNWREISAIYNADNKIFGSLSDRNKLGISCLFGTINSELQGSHLPVTPLEFISAKSNAVRILAKYTNEVISPLGTIIIDGYNSEDDWMEIDMILSVVVRCNVGQVHYFGKPMSTINSSWEMLVNRGIITEYNQSFAEYLVNEEGKGNIDFDELVFERENNRRVMINKKSKSIPKNLYNTTTKSAIILDDSILTIDNLNLDEKEEKFRYFLYESGNRPIWEGFKWGFYFKRDREDKLKDKVKYELRKDFYTKPIILEGQSGAGKSVLLGKLSYDYKLENKYPILFIPKNIKSVNYEAIFDFCDWSETQNKAERVIIVWDASVYNDEITRYIELNNFLTSAGRKVLVIGSALKLNEKIKKTYSYENVEIDTKLSGLESKNICDVFNFYSGSSIDELTLKKYGEDSVFVACYRFLPPSRSNLRRGIIDEANKNRITLKEALKIKRYNSHNIFYKAFMDANIYVSDNFFEETVDLEKLLGYICVPAQFDITIPFSLILRCFDSKFSIDIANKIDELDFFRFVEGVQGDWEIGVRSSLEAEIVAKSIISDLQKQVNIIVKLISEVSVNDNYITEHSELDFIIDLLKAIGSNGKKGETYLPYYKQIAETLEKTRLNGIWDSRTILQESVFFREYAKTKQNQKDLIKKSQELIMEEINRIKNTSGYNNQHLGRLYCELASNLGAQLIEMLKKDKIIIYEVMEIYDKIDESLQYTRNYLPESFYALDICAWASQRILISNNIPEDIKDEVFANALSMYDEAEITNPEFYDLDEYNVRRMQLGEIHNQNKISEDAFKKLLEKGSGAGIYIKARFLLKKINLNIKLTKSQVEVCKDVLNFMDSYREIVRQDIRCLYLKFTLKWLVYVGHPILYSEKQTLKLNKSEWEEILDTIDSILEMTPYRLNAVLKYVRAIALFHLDRKSDYLRAFKEISHIYYPFNRRIIMNYIASKENGDVRTYTGTILSFSNDKKTMFHINELGIDAPYFNKNFAKAVHAKGENFEEIELGFNFLGIQVSHPNTSGGR